MANIYSIENLLIGKIYRSKSLTGEIIDVEPHKTACYLNAEAFLVRIRKDGGGYTYRTVAVKDKD